MLKGDKYYRHKEEQGKDRLDILRWDAILYQIVSLGVSKEVT